MEETINQLRNQVAAYQEHFHELGQHLVVVHKAGIVDEEAIAILDGYHVGVVEVEGGKGEDTLTATIRLLKLAHARGAFAPNR